MDKQTIGVALIARNAQSTIRSCVESFIKEVDQCVVVLAGKSTDRTPQIVKKMAIKNPTKIQYYSFDWIDDFAAARNYSFSKLTADFLMWVDADDTIYQPENMREIIKNIAPETGAIWFPYHYAIDEFGNIATRYERERLLRANCGWIWRGRLHETVSPLIPCKYVRAEQVIILHNHLGSTPRNERNFRILNIMLQEDPNDKRIWLYLGHQYFATQDWLKAAEWYLKFGADPGAIALERFQALCYASKALREMNDYQQSLDTALMAISLFPQYKDGYLEAAHSFLTLHEWDKAIHFARLSDVREIMQEPPAIIFINPMDYTFNKIALLLDAHLQKGELSIALKYARELHQIRPIPELLQRIQFIEQLLEEHQISDSIKRLAVHLLNNRELFKLTELLKVTPYWFRDLPDYEQLRIGIEHYTKDLKSEAEMVEGEDKSIIVNIANAYNAEGLLKDLDAKYDKVTIISPLANNPSQLSNVLSQSDMERLIISSPDRHIINLQQEEQRLICEYDKKMPKGLLIKMFIGQGLQPWNPKKIREVGEGGSETSAALLADAFAKRDNGVIVYAMDNQIWDGVMYRYFNKFSPTANPCNLFISSRIPDIFNESVATQQKWLWMHDIHSGSSLTPDIASSIDVIITLSHWHCEHLKRVYPFLQDCEVIDLDGLTPTYEDNWTAGIFHEGQKCFKLPRIIISGDAIDTTRFKNKQVTKVPNRFIWVSSPDRGLEEVLLLWQKIKSQLPDAQLKIFYGWDYFNTTLWIPAQREMKERLRLLLKQDGVEWCGRIGQEELAEQELKASFLLYPPPHQFRETYGIAFLEAQAAGIICFYRMNGALGETIGDRGVPLPMDMKPDDIVSTIVETAKDEKKCAIIRESARQYGLSRDWEGQADKLLKLYHQKE